MPFEQNCDSVLAVCRVKEVILSIKIGFIRYAKRILVECMP